MAQRSELDPARKAYNLPCVIAQTLDVLGDRWTLLILRDLMAGLQRYNDILESCSGMSPNVLSDRLKRLEAEGLVDHTPHQGSVVASQSIPELLEALDIRVGLETRALKSLPDSR